ncbi:MAG TPA: YceI family protein [Aquaticitalea sp.]|nr:YceI family protein [Aquaticitalea sp.]
MRIFSYLILIILATPFSKSSTSDYMVICTNEFTVQGKTSLGSFVCSYEMPASDTLFFNNKKRNAKIIHTLPVRNFGCGNFILNGDFRKTLNAKEYPEIKIELSNFRITDNRYTCDLMLNLVGKPKQFRDLELQFYNNSMCGELVLNFSDFDLEPPKKLGGMVKVKEEIALNIKMVSSN